MMFKKKFLIGFGISLLIVTAILFLINFEDDEPESLPPPLPVKKITVYVSGQVKNISVIELEDNGDLRWVDAVNAAGGLTDFADSDAVNLAEPLLDGQRVHIPTKEIFLLPKNISGSDDLININTADAQELTKLKGIGPAMAQRIIDYREENGAFKTIDEIKNVSGIGEKRFAAIKNKIRV